MRIVDLSQEIFQGMPVYQGHLRTVIWEHEGHAETAERFEGGFSFQSRGLMLCDHGPTHVDALSHLDPADDAATIDEMDLSQFFGPGTCLDVSAAGPHEYIGADALEAAVEADGAEVRPGDVLLLCTGTYNRVGGTRAYTTDYPGFDESAAEWLLKSGVKIFGVDSPSPDNPISRTYPVHMMCRREGITHYENLAQLEQLVGKRFTFHGLPLKIRAGTGSPVRAIAVLEE
ncbi:MAG TPA: cyclase family protein [Solirubrobacterales bacterium]|nr:cyclase family protein [Solirubrobacterales bacterium]